jgi:large repetitive protein
MQTSGLGSRYQCSINGGSWAACPSNVERLGHGTTIVAQAIDNAGNVSANSNTVTIQRDTQAPNAPSVTLGGFTGVPPWNPTTVSYAHNGDNGPSGVNRIECSINGGAFSSSDCVTSAPPNHGTTISARVVDNAGNVGPATTVTVQRDTQAPNAPSVTLGGFTGVPPWNPTTVSYAHNGDNGPSGVNRIECSINGGAFSSSNCVTSAPPNHGTTISARVVDNAGNVGPVTTVTVQRDTQAPNAPSVILGGFSGGTWNPTTISYAHNGDNGPSGVNWPASLECSVNGGAWSSTCPDNTTLPTLPHGTTIAARVRDNAGNQGPAGTATVQRDTTPPATAISAIAPEYRNTPRSCSTRRPATAAAHL